MSCTCSVGRCNEACSRSAIMANIYPSTSLLPFRGTGSPLRAKVFLSVINIVLPVSLNEKRPLQQRALGILGNLHVNDADLFIGILFAVAHGQHGALNEGIDLGVGIDSLCGGNTRAEFDLQGLAVCQRNLAGLHAR
jgi:hypothetical protein